MPAIRCLSSAFLAVGALAATAAAQTPTGYQVDRWSTDDGLPSVSISDMVQTRDGFLWLAAGGSLVRFDGFEFLDFNAGNHPAITHRVQFLHAGDGDTLWVVLEDGALLAVAEGRVTRVQQLPAGVPIEGLVQERNGTLLALGEDVWRRVAGQFRPVGLTLARRPITARRPLGWRDAAGLVWLLGEHGALFRLGERGADPAGTTIVPQLVLHPSRGQVLAVRRNGALAQVVDGTGVVLASYRPAEDVVPHLVDRSGRLWAAAPGEVRVYGPGSPEPLDVFAVGERWDMVVEDLDGSIWVAGERGLMRIQRMALRTLGERDGVPRGQVRRITPGPSGSVLLLTERGEVYRVRGDSAEPYDRGPVGGASADPYGTVWLARLGPRGATLAGRRAGLPDLVMPRAGAPDLHFDQSRPGTAWFAGDGVLYRAEPYAAGGPRILDSLVVGGTIRRCAVGPGGVLWVVADGAGGQRLLKVEGDSVRTFSGRDGLPAAAVRALLPDSDGTLWLGTYGAGLARLSQGGFRSVHRHDGLAEDVVSNILEDGSGNFWMSGNRGIHRVGRAEVTAFLDGRVGRVHGVSYGRRDGMSDPEASGLLGVRGADGRLWFPTLDGAVVVDPDWALALDSAPPRVYVLGIGTSGDTLLPAGTARLPLGHRRLSIAYTAISLRNPAAVRFEYRLDGVDRDWIHAGTDRVATYNLVGPGRYTFRVRAVGAGGTRSAAPASISFLVPRRFYETVPFYLLVVGLLVASARYAWILRIRQMQRRQDRLRAMVDERTGELQQALATVAAQADQLRKLDEAKSRFFANASHEFRTPLSLILGPVEDVRDGRTGPLPEPARRRLDTALASGRRLVQLVEQLLDVARLESGTLRLNLKVHDLVPLLRRISESFASLAERRGLGFSISCPVGGVRVRCDTDQLEKVFTNLLGNALKFTPSGGRVDLRASTQGAGSDGWVVVEVEDTGPGIPAAHLDHVFDRFYQVDDSPRRAHQGAGIGLALARELVDMHGGRLTVHSVEGAGATFVVRLPLAALEAQRAEEPPVGAAVEKVLRSSAVTSAVAEPPLGLARANGDVTTVLVVEDNAELREYLREHLEERYRVIEADTGALALRLAREQVPDLIVSDVMMPELDGQALCAAVKADPETDFIPVILLTAKASRDSRLAGLEGGADDYLAKPVDVRELKVRAANLISLRRRLRERYREEQRDLPVLRVPLKPGPRDAASDTLLERLYAAMAERLGDEDFQVDDLAAAVGLGRSTLYRRLQELLGRSPMDVLWDYRLEQAALWLAETDANVSEIAYGVGFKSVPHFCSRFRERYDRTPSSYRRNRAEAAPAR